MNKNDNHKLWGGRFEAGLENGLRNLEHPFLLTKKWQNLI